MWQHQATGGWYFVSLPQTLSTVIRENLKFQEEGWGRMKCKAKINNTEWESAIWFDTKLDTYILPLKAAVRKKEDIKIDDLINLQLFV